MNGSVQLRAAFNDYRITDSEFASLNIEGNSELYEVNFRQPLVRSTKEEFALSLGFSHRYFMFRHKISMAFKWGL